jgi:hypothetical protein
VCYHYQSSNATFLFAVALSHHFSAQNIPAIIQADVLPTLVRRLRTPDEDLKKAICWALHHVAMFGGFCCFFLTVSQTKDAKLCTELEC